MRGERPAASVKLGAVVLHGGVPLLVGGFLYLLARPTSLLLFEWAGSLGLGPALAVARHAAAPLVCQLPVWVVYSLPNALWAYAFTALMLRLWDGRVDANSWGWIALGPLAAVGLELGQLARVVPGRFDPLDLALVLVASLLALGGLERRGQWQEEAS